METITQRRSINFFDSTKKITDDQLRNLLDIANTSPSSFNLQPWEVIAVTTPEKKKILKELSFNQPKVEEASVILIIIANQLAVEENTDRVLESWVKLGYMPKDEADKMKPMPLSLYQEKDSIKRIRFAEKNAAFFAMTVMIAAKEMGFDTHPMDGIDESGIKKAFNISDHKNIPLLIALGYKKDGFELLPRAFRKELDEFVTII